jgi:hypothetical protein
MLNSLDLLVIVFLALCGAGLLALCLLFLSKKPIVRRICLFILAALSLYLTYGGIYIGITGFPVQVAVAAIAGIAAVASVVLELAGKSDKSGKWAHILSVAGLVLGMAAAFFI